MSSNDVHGANILLVENLDANLEILARNLHAKGYKQVHKTNDADEAIELNRKTPFDLIVLDLDYLGASGLQLMKILNETSKTHYPNAVVLSEDPDLRLRGLQLGARDSIAKPFDIDELFARVHNLLALRLLFKSIERHVVELEQQFIDRTAELQVSEARFRAFTDLASDWYWEQDHTGNFTKVSGPVPEILGIEVDSTAEETSTQLGTGWDADEQSILRSKISAHEPFLDFEFTRNTPEDGRQTYLVSGQPMFDRACNFLGYRGIGVEISALNKH